MQRGTHDDFWQAVIVRISDHIEQVLKGRVAMFARKRVAGGPRSAQGVNRLTSHPTIRHQR